MVTTRSGRVYATMVSNPNTVVKRKATKVFKRKRTGTATTGQIQRVIMAMSDNKQFIGVDGPKAIPHATYKAWNPLYYIGIGTASNQRIGDSIFIQNIECLFTVATNRAGIHVDDNRVWFALVKADSLQNKDGTLGNNSDGFTFPDLRVSAAGDVCNPCVDTRQYHVLWQTQFSLNWLGGATITSNSALTPLSNTFNTDYADQIHPIRKTIVMNKKFTFSTTSSGYAQKDNLYFVMGYNNQGAAAMVTASCQFVVNYKDL